MRIKIVSSIEGSTSGVFDELNLFLKEGLFPYKGLPLYFLKDNSCIPVLIPAFPWNHALLVEGEWQEIFELIFYFLKTNNWSLFCYLLSIAIKQKCDIVSLFNLWGIKYSKEIFLKIKPFEIFSPIIKRYMIKRSIPLNGIFFLSLLSKKSYNFIEFLVKSYQEVLSCGDFLRILEGIFFIEKKHREKINTILRNLENSNKTIKEIVEKIEKEANPIISHSFDEVNKIIKQMNLPSIVKIYTHSKKRQGGIKIEITIDELRDIHLVRESFSSSFYNKLESIIKYI